MIFSGWDKGNIGKMEEETHGFSTFPTGQRNHWGVNIPVGEKSRKTGILHQGEVEMERKKFQLNSY